MYSWNDIYAWGVQCTAGRGVQDGGIWPVSLACSVIMARVIGSRYLCWSWGLRAGWGCRCRDEAWGRKASIPAAPAQKLPRRHWSPMTSLGRQPRTTVSLRDAPKARSQTKTLATWSGHCRGCQVAALREWFPSKPIMWQGFGDLPSAFSHLLFVAIVTQQPLLIVLSGILSSWAMSHVLRRADSASTPRDEWT